MRLSCMLMIAAALAPGAGGACVEPAPDVAGTEQPVTPSGGRVLAMDVGPGPGETLDAAVAAARAAGVATVVLNYDWSQIEPAAFQYQSAKLAADNAYYAAAPHAMSIVLNVRPIAGPCRVAPPDLAGLAWSDPVMIARFGYLLTWIHGYLPGLDVKLMSIGTEVDSHLSPADYAGYKVFFEAARQRAKDLWGAALPVGVAVTRDALAAAGPEQAAILDLDEHADHVLYTYYPLNADLTVKDPYAGPIADTYAALAAVEGSPKTAGRPIDLIEVGYPTSAALGSSLALQQSFVTAMFGIWDAYYPRIRTVVFNWESDLPEQVAELVAIGGWGGGACQAPAGAPPPAPGAPTVTPRGTSGTRTWQYYVVAVNASGNSLPGPTGQTVAGAAALSATSFNRIAWAPVAGATQYKVMRLASGGAPASTGLIGTTASTTLDDTGAAASTYAFQEFIRTLGYRAATTPVTDKPGLAQLAAEAHARGW